MITICNMICNVERLSLAGWLVGSWPCSWLEICDTKIFTFMRVTSLGTRAVCSRGEAGVCGVRGDEREARV